MVPNHVGIDSRWVIEHPDWFVSRDDIAVPRRTPSAGPTSRATTASRSTSRTTTTTAPTRRWSSSASTARPATTRYVYHGNDGTSMPWNDTAQLDYLNPEVREAVIQTILHVARQFPVIRFDAAMTLAKRHYPAALVPGARDRRRDPVARRARHDRATSSTRAMPVEFWREVVDRVAAEAPGHAAAGRGVLDDGGLLRPHARACTASTTAPS